MLVLSRKVGETIVIADNITITVKSIRGTNITLGIEAPKEMPVMRGELVAAGEGPVSRKTEPPA